MCRINFTFVGLVLEAVVLPRQNSSQIKAFIWDFIFNDLSHSKLKRNSNQVPSEWGWHGNFELGFYFIFKFIFKWINLN